MANAPQLPLFLARAGYHIFPLQPGGKRPLADSRGHLDATTDERRIAAWTDLHPGCNWGISCEQSGLAVVDVDTKDGKAGDDTLAALEAEHGKFAPAMVVYTPSGGRHLYFRGDCPSTQGDRGGLGPGVDTRGAGGYVVAPGCETPQGKYRISDGTLRRVEEHPYVPAWVADALRRDAAPQADVQLELDDAQANALYWHATTWLAQHAHPAIQGQGGDQTTYETACRLRDMGLDEPAALDAMLDAYNHRCEPPWEPEELAQKVANAYRYARSTPGIVAAEAVFQPYELPDDEVQWADDPWERKREAAKPTVRTIHRADAIDADTIPPREWVLGHRLIRDYITLTVSPGGVGKSVLTTVEGIAIATGTPLTGDQVHLKGPVLLVSTEDPAHEIQRRIVATAIRHDIPRAALRDVHYLSSADDPLRLVVPGEAFGSIRRDDRAVEWLIRYIREHGIVAAVFDPFVRTHMVSENDNMAIDAVAQVFARVAQEAHCAIHLVHHTRKRGDAGGRGDAELARGASAIVNAARICHTLDVMDADEAEKYGVPENERRWWLRLDDAKSNLAPPAESVRWFRRESVTLPTGDAVGTLRVAAAEELVARPGEELALAAALLALYEDDPLQVVGATPNAVGRLLQTRGNAMPGASEDKVRRAVVRMVERGLALPGGQTMKLVASGGGRGRKVLALTDCEGVQP